MYIQSYVERSLAAIMWLCRLKTTQGFIYSTTTTTTTNSSIACLGWEGRKAFPHKTLLFRVGLGHKRLFLHVYFADCWEYSLVRRVHWEERAFRQSVWSNRGKGNALCRLESFHCNNIQREENAISHTFFILGKCGEQKVDILATYWGPLILNTYYSLQTEDKTYYNLTRMHQQF